MLKRLVVWLPSVRNKLLQFRSERFTPEETFDYIAQFMLNCNQEVQSIF